MFPNFLHATTLLAQDVNLALRKLYRPVTFVYGTEELIFPLDAHGNFLPILLPIVPHNDH